MSALEFNNSLLEPSGPKLFDVFGTMAAGSVNTREAGIMGTPGTSDNFGINWLHKSANQLATGDTLDEVLSCALNFITALVHCQSCFTHVLKDNKFEPWVWKTPESKSESATRLDPDVVRFLAEYKAPIAISGRTQESRRARIFEDWARDTGETFISVPLLFRMKLVGAISLQHAPRVYSEVEVKLLSTIGFIIGADIAVSLVEAQNAFLSEELEMKKLVERGKGILQRDLRVSEQQAYLILEHLSRQKRKPLKEVARAIILGDEVKRVAADS